MGREIHGENNVWITAQWTDIHGENNVWITAQRTMRSMVRTMCGLQLNGQRDPL